MLEIYDKAQWHIDAGENPDTVIRKFEAVFQFLKAKGLLQQEGEEMLEIGIDSSISLHERMVTEKGKEFLKTCYDKVINQGADTITDSLEREYGAFKKNAGFSGK